MFGTVVNPETGRRVNVNGATGQRVLGNYAKQLGGRRRKAVTQGQAANRMFSAAAGRGRPAGRTVSPTRRTKVAQSGCRYMRAGESSRRPCRIANAGRSDPKCVRGKRGCKQRGGARRRPSAAQLAALARGRAIRKANLQKGGARGRRRNAALDGCGFNVRTMRCGSPRSQRKVARGAPALNKSRCRRSGRRSGRTSTNNTCVKRPGAPKNAAAVARGKALKARVRNQAHFVKGSAAARTRMAELRAMRS